jgi:hypothetical protein
MTRVDLRNIRTNDARKAINWLVQTYGAHGDRWTCTDLTYVEFRKDRDATMFLLHWA